MRRSHEYSWFRFLFLSKWKTVHMQTDEIRTLYDIWRTSEAKTAVTYAKGMHAKMQKEC